MGGGCTNPPATRPPDPTVTVDLQGRTYDLFLPPGIDVSDGGLPPDGGTEDGGGPGDAGAVTTPVPLFIELHGFTNAATDPTPWFGEETANQFIPEAQKRGIITVLPHGSYDPLLGHWFWNATDACCDLEKSNPNDIGYLMAVIQDVESKYNIDDKRIFAFGHSNGGFMVNRLACDQADKIAAVVSLAGETYTDQCKCAASAAIGYLQVQGDADMTVPYAGGHPENIVALPDAPGAIETTQDWAKKNRCSATADTSQPMIQLMTISSGPDTKKLVYDTGCEGNGETELWTIHLGPHSPSFNSSWAPAVFDWLMAHPKS